jgi:hypothetical protein
VRLKAANNLAKVGVRAHLYQLLTQIVSELVHDYVSQEVDHAIYESTLECLVGLVLKRFLDHPAPSLVKGQDFNLIDDVLFLLCQQEVLVHILE